MTKPRVGEPNQMSLDIVEEPLSSGDISQLDNITLFYFAYRGFTADADRLLKEIGFGRAHHRVLFFVCRKPAMNVAELLEILSITKQSLARVLRQMVAKNYIVQKPGPSDRRQRLLYPTPSGHELMLSLSRLQSARLTEAIRLSGIGEDKQLSMFLDAMIEPRERNLIQKLAPTNAGNQKSGNEEKS